MFLVEGQEPKPRFVGIQQKRKGREMEKGNRHDSFQFYYKKGQKRTTLARVTSDLVVIHWVSSAYNGYTAVLSTSPLLSFFFKDKLCFLA